MDYIRFTTYLKDASSNRPQGIFQTLFDLKNQGKMQAHEVEWFERTLMWFDKNLEAPDNFTRSNKPHSPQVGLCWYKSNAHHQINKMYELIQMLALHSIEVNIIKTNKPGYIVFEDEHQIVAEPFAETKGSKLKR